MWWYEYGPQENGPQKKNENGPQKNLWKTTTRNFGAYFPILGPCFIFSCGVYFHNEDGPHMKK